MRQSSQFLRGAGKLQDFLALRKFTPGLEVTACGQEKQLVIPCMKEVVFKEVLRET